MNLPPPRARKAGFTLIELSIVLVIIGLIIGGVLVGQDLIKAATTRAQLTQIEKYNQAVNTFKNKYGGIPGDLSNISASQFGFTVGTNCLGTQGARDGNGVLDGWASPLFLVQNAGETGLFWTDLSTAGFTDGVFPGNGAAAIQCVGAGAPVLTLTPGTTYVGDYFPTAKIGQGNFLYVYEVSGLNWFGISAIQSENSGGGVLSNTTIPVTQAYNMDKKVDDGLPTTGNVQAQYMNNSNTAIQPAPNGNPDTASTCYNSSTLTYSTNISNGSNPNCALSFKMQGAAR